MPLSVSCQSLLRSQVPGQEASVTAHGDGVLVVREELEIVDTGSVLFQVRDHVSRFDLPNTKLPFCTTGNDEAHVGGELDRGDATLVRIVYVPKILPLIDIPAVQLAVVAAGNYDVLRSRYRQWVGTRPCGTPQLGGVVVGIPKRHQTISAAGQEMVRDLHRIRDVVESSCGHLAVRLHREVLGSDQEAKTVCRDRQQLRTARRQGHRSHRPVQPDLPLLPEIEWAAASEDCACPISANHCKPRAARDGKTSHASHSARTDRDEGLNNPIFHEDHCHVSCGGACKQILVILGKRQAHVLSGLLP
mmetsp:Transcript_39906/g.64518  ORF Transcript_39906/g.64518 Transcript_39906/m.64518 type:complete len:304 (-) Transcript_39906:625-1536(-)